MAPANWHSTGRRFAAALALTAAIAVAWPGGARAADVRPAITTKGVHFVNADGVPVVLRGVNIGYHSRYLPEVSELGANFARIRVLWSKVEPERGVFDEHELSRLDTVVQELDAEHIAIELDLRGAPTPAWFGSPVGFWKVKMKASHAAYKVFVREIVQRYSGYRYVIGYGIYNEPHTFSPMGLGTHAIDQTILHWQAAIRNQILALDPNRVVFFSVRGGNYGIEHADFSAAGFKLAHTVYDWHSFYNGSWGSGFDQQNDNWIPSWPQTHNQRSRDYQGTQLNQWLNLDIPWRRTHLLDIPMIVGEWGVRDDDANRAVYDDQMAAIFDKTGVSWARWAVDSHKMGLVRHHSLNDQGSWLKQYIAAHSID